jgi:hypothetical protein
VHLAARASAKPAGSAKGFTPKTSLVSLLLR